MSEFLLGTCSSCKFYKMMGNAERGINNACVAHAPVPILGGLRPDGAPLIITAFPGPEPTWTCGEHRPKLAS